MTIRKYSSTPLLNEIDLDLTSEESGWVSNSNSRRSSDISSDGKLISFYEVKLLLSDNITEFSCCAPY